MWTAPLLALTLLLAGTPGQPPSGSQAGRSPQDLARDLQAKYDRIQSFSADFEHIYEGGVLRKKITERGTVLVKKPGMMRWAYTAPEKKEFVSDGRRLYSYIPEDRQVIVSEQDEQRSLAARLLSGKGGLSEEFSASLESPQEEGVMRLLLVPRHEQADVERAFVDVEPSGRIRSILLDDVQGNRTRFRFSGVRENTGLKDELFRFEVPKGVEVIRG